MKTFFVAKVLTLFALAFCGVAQAGVIVPPSSVIITSASAGIVGGYTDGSETAKVRAFLARAAPGVELVFTPTANPITITSTITTAMPSYSRVNFKGVQFSYADTEASTGGQVSALAFTGSNYELDNLNLTCATQSQQYNGLQISQSSHVLLVNPYVSNCRWSGIAVFDVAAGTSTFVVINDAQTPLNRFGITSNSSNFTCNRCNPSYSWAATAEGVANGGVWNSSSQYYDGIILTGGNTINLVDTISSGVGQSCVYVGPVTNLTISGGQFTGCNNKGIDVGPSTPYAANIIVQGAYISNNKVGNVNLYHATGGLLSANVISDTIGQDDVDLQTGVTGMLVENNILIGNAFKVFEEGVVTPHATGNFLVGNVDGGGSGTFQLNEAENFGAGNQFTDGTTFSGTMLRLGCASSTCAALKRSGATITVTAGDGTTPGNLVASGYIQSNGSVTANGAVQANGSFRVLPTTSSASALVLTNYGTHYVFTGTTATWTLPTVATGGNIVYFIKNRGTGALTINSATGGNDIFSTSAVATVMVATGSAVRLVDDGTYWNVE